MKEVVTPYKTNASKKAQVAAMFNAIAHRYDFLNGLLSFGIHVYWRKRAIAALKIAKPQLILDIATGTGDFAIEALRLHPQKVTGVDISAGMLDLGKAKIKKRGLEDRIELQLGDSEQLPFGDNSFDAVTVAFGVRNFENLDKGLQSILRVLKPGGQLVVLEFSQPTNGLVKFFYRFYSNVFMPAIGRFFSKDAAAYTYLPESVNQFPHGAEFLSILKENGFVKTSCKGLTFKIATVYVAYK